MIEKQSPHSVAETVEKLTTIIEEKGLKVMTTIDHSKAAEIAEMELRPTRLIIFGNPQVGTLMMQQDQRMGIDLPLKFLVWEDEDDNTWITYHDIRTLLDDQAIELDEEVINKVMGAMNSISDGAITD
ncbi:MAG: DUF302 domain-containing protein [Bacteroidetes bacterium]|nr:DUF302 domain-containing protein [Bacteroidota bacterium]